MGERQPEAKTGGWVGIKMGLAAMVVAAVFALTFSALAPSHSSSHSSKPWWPQGGESMDSGYLPIDASVTVGGFAIQKDTTFLELASHLGDFSSYKLETGDAGEPTLPMELGDLVAQPVNGDTMYDIVCADASSEVTFTVSAQKTGQVVLGDCLVYAASAELTADQPQAGCAASGVAVYGVSVGDSWHQLEETLGEPRSIVYGQPASSGSNAGEARFEDVRADAVAAFFGDDGENITKIEIGIAVDNAAPMPAHNADVAEAAEAAGRKAHEGSSSVSLLGQPVKLGETRLADLSEYIPDLTDAADAVSGVSDGIACELVLEVPGAVLEVSVMPATGNDSDKVRCLNGTIVGASYRPQDKPSKKTASANGADESALAGTSPAVPAPVAPAPVVPPAFPYLEYAGFPCGSADMFALVELYGTPDSRVGDIYRYRFPSQSGESVDVIAMCAEDGGVSSYSVELVDARTREV